MNLQDVTVAGQAAIKIKVEKERQGLSEAEGLPDTAAHIRNAFYSITKFVAENDDIERLLPITQEILRLFYDLDRAKELDNFKTGGE